MSELWPPSPEDLLTFAADVLQLSETILLSLLPVVCQKSKNYDCGESGFSH